MSYQHPGARELVAHFHCSYEDVYDAFMDANQLITVDVCNPPRRVALEIVRLWLEGETYQVVKPKEGGHA